jgi:lambda family phage portal protein
MNIFDKAIALVAPKMGLERARSREALSIIEEHKDRRIQKRRFEGAGYGHRYEGFNSKVDISLNQLIHSDIKQLVLRSRNLSINNPYAKRAAKVISNNVVGTGIVPTISPATRNKKDVDIVKRAWKKWGEKNICDYDGKFNFYGIEKLLMRTVVTSGEALVIKKSVSSGFSEIGLQLLVLEGEYIDMTKHNYLGGGYIIGQPYDYYGIRFDSDNRILGYWIYDRHPLEGNIRSTFVKAENVIHIYDVDRAQQHRGVPFSSTTILKQRDLDDYEDAEIVAKKVAASFAGFVQNTDPANDTHDNDRFDHIEPGTINYLNPNETMAFPTPPQNPGYSDFIKNTLRAIATGYGVTYEQLTNDYSNVNFSSGRMGWLEFQKNVDEWQSQMLIPMFCEKAFEWFLEGCRIGLGISKDNINVSWTAPRREMIDPVKELNALVKRSRAGFVSWQETVRELGFNPEDVLQQLSADQKAFQNAGLMPDSNPMFELMAKLAMNKGNAPQDNNQGDNKK